MKENIIRVLVIDPNDGLYEERIPNALEALQELVGGHIEVAYSEPDWALLCDEEGKLKRRAFCRSIVTEGGDWIDDLVGTLVVAGVDGEEFCDLTDIQVRALRALFSSRTVTP